MTSRLKWKQKLLDNFNYYYYDEDDGEDEDLVLLKSQEDLQEFLSSGKDNSENFMLIVAHTEE